MLLDMFVICDAHEMKVDKLTIHGIQEGIYVENIPAQHPLLCIVASIYLSREEAGIHSFSFRIFFPNGNPMLDSNVIRETNRRELDDGSFRTIITFDIPNLRISVKGRHSIALYVDGELAGQIPLYII